MVKINIHKQKSYKNKVLGQYPAAYALEVYCNNIWGKGEGAPRTEFQIRIPFLGIFYSILGDSLWERGAWENAWKNIVRKKVKKTYPKTYLDIHCTGYTLYHNKIPISAVSETETIAWESALLSLKK